jgi:RHS repeat-associated protein
LTSVSYYGYDLVGRISLLQHRKRDGTQIEKWTYTRDEAGNITKQLRSSDTVKVYWDYDQANRIVKEAWNYIVGLFTETPLYGYTYTYDAAGNRNQRRQTLGTPSSTYWDYDQADQPTIQKQDAVTKVYFTYDSAGNLSLEHDVDASAGRTYYEYDPRNLLTKIDFPGAIATNYFYYNGLAERTRKDDSTGGKKYTWDGNDVIVEKNLSDTTTQRLMKGASATPGVGHIILQDLSGTIIYPHKNQIGTVMRHTNAGQTVVNTYEYDAWGVPIAVSEANAQQYRFSQKELDPDAVAFNSQNSRYHFPARAYIPLRGNFIQIDPLAIGRPGRNQGLYLYAMANPLVRIDPDGRFVAYGDMAGNALGGIGNRTDFDLGHLNQGIFLFQSPRSSIGAGSWQIWPPLVRPLPPGQDPGTGVALRAQWQGFDFPLRVGWHTHAAILC